MEYKTLSENIKTLRKKNKLTQKELAEKIYKSEILIRKYESGKVNIPPSTLYDLCNIFNVSSETILGSDFEKYQMHNWGEVVNTDSNTVEEGKTPYKEYQNYVDSWRDEVFRIENLPSHLLNSILNYLENVEKYNPEFAVNINDDESNDINYLTDEQVNDITDKVTDLVKYELYKLSNKK